MLDNINSGNPSINGEEIVHLGNLWLSQGNKRADMVMFECSIQHTNNYRFECEFVLKYYSN